MIDPLGYFVALLYMAVSTHKFKYHFATEYYGQIGYRSKENYEKETLYSFISFQFKAFLILSLLHFVGITKLTILNLFIIINAMLAKYYTPYVQPDTFQLHRDFTLTMTEFMMLPLTMYLLFTCADPWLVFSYLSSYVAILASLGSIWFKSTLKLSSVTNTSQNAYDSKNIFSKEQNQMMIRLFFVLEIILYTFSLFIGFIVKYDGYIGIALRFSSCFALGQQLLMGWPVKKASVLYNYIEWTEKSSIYNLGVPSNKHNLRNRYDRSCVKWDLESLMNRYYCCVHCLSA